MKTSKFLVGAVLVASSFTAFARVPGVNVSAQGCNDYGDIVGSMQDIRNKGGSINLAFNDLQNLLQSKDAGSRRLGTDLQELARHIWAKPQGELTRARAAVLGEAICNKQYRD